MFLKNFKKQHSKNLVFTWFLGECRKVFSEHSLSHCNTLLKAEKANFLHMLQGMFFCRTDEKKNSKTAAECFKKYEQSSIPKFSRLDAKIVVLFFFWYHFSMASYGTLIAAKWSNYNKFEVVVSMWLKFLRVLNVILLPPLLFLNFLFRSYDRQAPQHSIPHVKLGGSMLHKVTKYRRWRQWSLVIWTKLERGSGIWDWEETKNT